MRQLIVTLLALLLSAFILACEVSKGDQFPAPAKTGTASVEEKECDPKKVPGDKPNLDNKRYVTVYACVEDGYQPLELLVSARDNDTGEYGEHNEPSADTKVSYVVGYDTGHHVTLHVELKPSRPGSVQGFLYISDGPMNRKTVMIDRSWRALADFTVAR